MRREKGITLIALVITIVILIILAGVAINLTLGDNGIFNKAKLAKEKYNEESIREKVELGIMELEIDELTLGNQITIESVLQELLEKETFETIDKDVAIGNIGEYEVKLKYNEQGKVVIEYIEKATGVRVTYKLNPESYTNGEKVGILLTVNGKVKSVTKPDNLIIYPENSTLAINYQVTANGTYKFIIEDEEGNKQEKNVVVDTIDRLPPNDFTITAENIKGGIRIIANTTDAESDGVSVKSGIERYEYFVKGENDTEYTKYKTNEITGLKRENYSIYVIAYDKAGSPKSSNTLTMLGLEISISDLKVGDYIKYNTGKTEVGTGGVVLCRVLYNDEEHGLQIITDNTIKILNLGNPKDYEAGKELYNSVIQTLNDETEVYINSKYVYDARCVGSAPTVENGMYINKDKIKLKGTEKYVAQENTKTVSIPDSWKLPTGWETRDTGCYNEDINYEEDRLQAESVGIWTLGNLFWLASLDADTLDTNSSSWNFGVRYAYTNGGITRSNLCYIDKNRQHLSLPFGQLCRFTSLFFSKNRY